MIQEKYIKIWKPTAPWELDKYVEQDLIICRAVVAIFSDEFLRKELAWRGGTALHKLYLKPQARYSEDIDLVQIHPGPIKPIVERLDKALAWLPNKSFDLRRFGFRQRFRFDSEIPPVEPMRLKIETNTYEHFSVLGYAHVPFTVDNPWFSGSCNVTTFQLNELLATKFRALYQRKKLRDLFDMDYAIRHAGISPDEILACWQKYMEIKDGTIPSQEEIIANLEAKLTEEHRYTKISGWWDRKGENEIDLVCENELTGALDFYEVKRDSSRIDLKALQNKVKAFFTKHPDLQDRTFGIKGLALADM